MDLSKLFLGKCLQVTRNTFLALDLTMEVVLCRIRTRPSTRFFPDIAETVFLDYLVIPEAIVTKISGLIELAIALLLHPILAQSDIGVKSYLRKTDLGLLGLFHRFLWIGKVANMCPNVKFNSESIAGEILKIASAVLQIFALLPRTTFQIP